MMFAGSSFVASVLLTYAVHSAVACVVALAIARLLQRPQHRDTIWKAALVVPIVTAASVFAIARLSSRTAAVDLSNVVREHTGRALPGRRVIVEMTANSGGTTVVRSLTDPVAAALSDTVLIVAIAIVMLALVRFVVRRRALRRLIAARYGGRMIGRSARGRPIVVSTCDDLQSPIALGDAEICLPTEVATRFDGAHRRALLAHEAAHLDRRDPAWIVAADTIAAFTAFQPLVFAVRRAFRRDAELICDEAALRDTGDRLALIGALALLAAPFDARGSHAGAVSAVDGSPLVARAERIATVSLGGKAARPGVALTAAIVIAFAVLLALPVLTPAVFGSTSANSRVRHMERERIVEVR